MTYEETQKIGVDIRRIIPLGSMQHESDCERVEGELHAIQQEVAAVRRGIYYSRLGGFVANGIRRDEAHELTFEQALDFARHRDVSITPEKSEAWKHKVRRSYWLHFDTNTGDHILTCCEDESAKPTHEELIGKWQVAYDDSEEDELSHE